MIEIADSSQLYLACPSCGSQQTASRLDFAGDHLFCVVNNQHCFPVKNGIVDFTASSINQDSPKRKVSFAERIFDYPALYRMKSKYLGRLNGLGHDMLETSTCGMEVLDVGCGSQQYLYDPAKTKFRIGIDSSFVALQASSKLYPDSIHAVVADLNYLPFCDKSFDVVLLLFVLHHLPPEIVPRLIDQAKRVARKYLVVLDHIRSDFFIPRFIQQQYWNICDGGTLYRSKKEWQTLWTGFKVIEYRRSGALFRNVCYYKIAV